MSNGTLVHRGITFNLAHEYDGDHPAPWEDGDGRGVVTDWLDPEIHEIPAGARRLHGESFARRARYYDWGATLIKAGAEGWGLGDEDRRRAEIQKGRPLTPAEVTIAAVEADYEFMRGWCTDKWNYVGVVVTLPTSGVNRSLWGIESNAGDYLDHVARELADELIDDDNVLTEIEARIAVHLAETDGITRARETCTRCGSGPGVFDETCPACDGRKAV